MKLAVGTHCPQWGHTWFTIANGRIYALKSLPGGSALCVLAIPEGVDEDLCTQDQMTLVGQFPTPGEHSCHITVLDRQVITCDYTSGSMSLYGLGSDGMPCGEPEVIRFEGHGPNPLRQDRPHLHSSWLSPDGTRLVAADLGTDHLYIFDISDGRIDIASMRSIEAPTGSGPRHCAFNADGGRLYVTTELSDELLTYSFPQMELLGRAVVNDAHPGGGGHVVISPDNRFLYASSRLQNDGLAVFRIGQDGIPVKTSYYGTGAHPRHFCLSPDGCQLAVGCRDDNVVELYDVDAGTGTLTKVRTIAAPRPAFVCFLPENS